MSKRYLDVSSIHNVHTVQPNLNNSIDVKGKLVLQDQEITGEDIKELKMMIDFLRHTIATDTRMKELWIAYKTKEKILR